MSEPIVMLKKSDLHAFLAEVTTCPYYTQDNSPLGRERHCLLVRSKAIPGWKRGRTHFARKVDVHAWIEATEEAAVKLPDNVRSRLKAAGARRA